MGTISEKLTYLNGTKQKLKQAINNIGGEVTDETTFREYVNQLDNIYDRLPKTEFEEGESVTLENTLKGKLDFDNGVVGIGQTEQDSTKGYQLWSLKDGTYSHNGAVAKVENGEITINGTTTAIAFVSIPLNNVVNWQTGQTYMISANNPSSGQVRLRINDTGSADLFLDSVNATKSVTYNETSVPSVRTDIITLRIQDGITLTNFKLKPMLESGSTAHEWEKYTGGQASPNPSYPQTINSVTGNQDVVVSGKNLLDIENCSLTSNGGTLTVNNGLFTISGTFTGGTTFVLENYVNFNNINKNNGDEITLSIKNFVNNGSSSLSYNRFWLDNSSNQYYLQPDNSTGVVSKTLDIELNRCRVYVPAGTYNTTFNVQIELGSTATTYEPYITPTSYQLSLGDIELNAIGNYRDELIYDVDEDKVYKNGNVNENIFNGSENISLQSINGYGIANFFISHSLGSVSGSALCDYFTLQTGGISVTQEEGFLWQYNGVYFRIKSSTASDVSSFKTWLSNHNIKVKYALATPTKTEITDTTLVNQVKALYNAHSNNGTTIITSNGNLPMIIKVRGLKGE